MLDKEVAGPHLRWPVPIKQVVLRTREGSNLLLGEARGCLPHRLAGLGVVEVRHAARGRQTDFPGLARTLISRGMLHNDTVLTMAYKLRRDGRDGGRRTEATPFMISNASINHGVI